MENNNLPYFLTLTRTEQKLAVESVIFSSEEPLNMKKLFRLLAGIEPETKEEENEAAEAKVEFEKELYDKMGFNEEYVMSLINDINTELIDTNRPFRISFIAGGYQYSTRPEFGHLIQHIVKSKVKKRLSQATLETLAIISYKQPVTRPVVDQIRGVNSKEMINSLLEKNLVKITGRSEAPGKPHLYATTEEFLRTFGLNSLEDLPKLKELDEIDIKALNAMDEGEDDLVIKIDEEDIDKLKEIADEISVSELTDINEAQKN